MKKIICFNPSQIKVLTRKTTTNQKRQRWDGILDLTGRNPETEKIEIDPNELEKMWDNILLNMDRSRIYNRKEPACYFKIGFQFYDRKDRIRVRYLIVDRTTLSLAGYELPAKGKKKAIDVVFLPEGMLETPLKGLHLAPETLATALERICATSHNKIQEKKNFEIKRRISRKKQQAYRLLAFILLDAAKIQSSRLAVKNCLAGEETLILPENFCRDGRIEKEIRNDLMKCNNHTPVICAWKDMAAGRYQRMVTLDEEAMYFHQREFSNKKKRKLSAIGVDIDIKAKALEAELKKE